VRQKSHECSVTKCRHCGFSPAADRRFSLHARRERVFFVVVGPVVHAIRAWLPRWRCPDCRRTFTEYVSAALTFRRYLLPQIRRCAWNYITQSHVDYRAIVRQSNLPIFHGDASAPYSDAKTDESDAT